jgi:hypothetical protein
VWAVGQSAGFFTFNTLTLHRTDPCAGATMHVASITPRFQAGGKAVDATISIVSAGGAPVSSAAVTVAITVPGGVQSTVTRTTNAQGRVTFSTPRRASGTYTFAVTAVTKTGFTYDPSANVETSDSIVVP